MENHQLQFDFTDLDETDQKTESKRLAIVPKQEPPTPTEVSALLAKNGFYIRRIILEPTKTLQNPLDGANIMRAFSEWNGNDYQTFMATDHSSKTLPRELLRVKPKVEKIEQSNSSQQPTTNLPKAQL
eukprot:727571_1